MNRKSGTSGQATEEIRILMLEDSAADAELMVRRLRKDNMAFACQRVETRDGFLEQLAEFKPDVVLADYSLPLFDALLALELVKELSLVTETDLGDGRVRYHCIGKGHHHHLVCEKCGEIIDIEESSLSPLWTDIQQKYNFKVNMKHLAFFGICPKCQT